LVTWSGFGRSFSCISSAFTVADAPHAQTKRSDWS
jgi:hypothetical protein